MDQERLEFEHRGQRLRLPVSHVGSSESPHTGRLVRELKTEVTVPPAEADLIRELLATGEVTDCEGAVWRGRVEMESYSDDGPHRLLVAWNEVERIAADAVEFEGLVLRPSRYEERAGDGGLVVSFQAALSVEETDTLRSLMASKRSGPHYWPVVRRGVEDAPRTMRLGRVLWQQFEDGRIGHDITLVEESVDSKPNPLRGIAGDPQVGNLVREVSSLLGGFEALLVQLGASGALSEEEIASIRAAATASGPTREHIFYEVGDLEDW